MNINVKGQKGISGVDLVISLAIVIVFVSIIAIVYTNLNSVNISIERAQKATDYAIEILEKTDELYYSEVNSETFAVNEAENGKHTVAGIEIARGYTVNVIIDNYNQTDGENNGRLDVVKTIIVQVEYKANGKTEEVEMKKIKTKEILEVPNKPKLEDGMIPAKYVKVKKTTFSEETGEYITTYVSKLINTTAEDTQWYDYPNKKWALATRNDTTYVWIPRYAYKSTETVNVYNVKFLYAYGTRYVNENGNLEQISNEYTIPDRFNNNENIIDGFWIEESLITRSESANILNSSIEYGPMSK